MKTIDIHLSMMKLMRSKEMSQVDIARRLDVSVVTVSRNLDKLYDQGFVDARPVKTTSTDGTRRDVKHYRLSKEWGGE